MLSEFQFYMLLPRGIVGSEDGSISEEAAFETTKAIYS
jgi:hypothetical protein